ncbi:MAG: hypothetical protein LC667_19750, partial [Thioalkalivibrio sp.]|nr:hypothetical protein [Thioalkalivibrio sp.]
MPDQDARRGTIRLRIKDGSQLFDSLDPDPCVERDLNDDVVAYITSWAREIPRHQKLKLVVEITEPKHPGEAETVLPTALRHYFDHAVMLARNDFHDLMRRGRLSLIIGLTVLALAVLGSNLLDRFFTGTISALFQQTVLIGGWVAMWRPLEIFLYDWWPLRGRRIDLERLRDMDVEI